MSSLLMEESWAQLEYALLRSLRAGLAYHRSMQAPNARENNFRRHCRILLYCSAGKHRCVAAAEILLMILRVLGVLGQCLHIGSGTGAWSGRNSCGPCSLCRGHQHVVPNELFALIREKCDLPAFARAVRPF